MGTSSTSSLAPHTEFDQIYLKRRGSISGRLFMNRWTIMDFCAQLGQVPKKPFTGKFVLRLSPDLHRRVYIAARAAGKSLNAWVADHLDETTAHAH
jgi:predicted HicB family RNase H-like nuclease